MARAFLNSRDKKQIIAVLKEQFGLRTGLADSHLIRDGEDLFLYTGDAIDFSQLRTSQVGVRIGCFRKEQLVLTLQGAQLIGPMCAAQILSCSMEDERSYLRGEDLETDADDGLYLLRSERDFFGCAFVKAGTVKNSMEKSRIINCDD